jgi:TatD DNase family protein
MALHDAHAHLTHPRIESDLPGVLERAEAAGVTTIVANGLDPDDNERVAALAREHSIVRPAFGFYPVDAVLVEMRRLGIDYPGPSAGHDPADGIRDIRERLDDAFAVGEIGLDGHWVPESLWEQQEQVFRELVSLAIEADLPIIVHTRKRELRTLEVLLELEARRVLWHCFGGKKKLALRIAAAGHYLSIPANARRVDGFAGLLAALPRERLLLETDCPYLAPEKGGQSEPAHVAGTATLAAELWGVDRPEAEMRFEENFGTLFRV